MSLSQHIEEGQRLHCLITQTPWAPHRPMHTHGFHEFYICQNASGVQYAADQELPMRAGDVFWFPAGRAHCCVGQPNTPARGIVIYAGAQLFSPHSWDRDLCGLLDYLKALDAGGINRLPLDPDTTRKAMTAARQLHDTETTPHVGRDAAMKLKIGEFLLHLLRDPNMAPHVDNASRTASARERLQKVLWHVQHHYPEAIRVADMARLAGMSRSHFHAMFRHETGHTLVEYITATRVAAARQMLTQTDMPILDVAYSCGFSSPSRFYAAFTSLTNTTPRQARKCG